jgi:hypothetical protein
VKPFFAVEKQSGKAITITYSESVFLALGIQHAMRMLWPIRVDKIFSLYVISGMIFEKKSF